MGARDSASGPADHDKEDVVQFSDWLDLVAAGAAIRRVRQMQPAGGIGDKLFPPTYPPENKNDSPRHVFEFRQTKSGKQQCVLIDSVQSQANRLEEALSKLRAQKRLGFPVIAVDFSASDDLADIGTIDTLQAPHRVFDAIIRDSMINGKPFGQSDEGRALVLAKPSAASIIYTPLRSEPENPWVR
jgi:CRISPR-associated protein Csb1